jgi:hypothetical protein
MREVAKLLGRYQGIKLSFELDMPEGLSGR